MGASPSPESDGALAEAEQGALVVRNARLASGDLVSLRAREGRIVAIDSDAGANGQEETLDVDGRLLLAAFNDAHLHAAYAGIEIRGCDLRAVEPDAQAYEREIERYAASHPDESWIIGTGWRHPVFPGGRPTKDLLDAIVADRPVCLRSKSLHEAWVNSAALRVAGVTATTPDPPGGTIGRGDAGEPDGALVERAVELVLSAAPAPTADEYERAIVDAERHLLAHGVVAFQDAAVAADGPLFEAYLRLAARHALVCRPSVALLWDASTGGDLDELEAARRIAARHGLLASTVKIFQDGTMTARTAALLSPYLDEVGSTSGTRGESLVEPAELRHVVTGLDARGFDVHVHAVGDRAVREALDAAEAARQANGRWDSRHQLAHLELVDPSDLNRFGELGVIANVQPYWGRANAYIDEVHKPSLGPERSARLYPFGALRAAGARLAIGTDWPIDAVDPLRGIEVAVSRVGPDDRSAVPLGPDQRLPLPVVLEAATLGSAFAMRREHDTGTLEVGKRADFVVLSTDILSGESPVADAAVLLTVAGGGVRYRAPAI